MVRIYGSENHLSQINIQDYYCRKYLIIYEKGSHNTLSNCNFEHRTYMGDQNILSVLVDSKVPGYNVIRYCSFRNFPGNGNDEGVEPIRIGLSTQGNFISRTTVEYCYFTLCNGDGEIISHKSRQNLYRYNTFENNPVGELTLRHGDQGVVYGNFFLNGMGGVRIKEGQYHVVYNNYFSGLTNYSMNLQNYSVDPLDSITIAYNTFVNSANVRLGAAGSYPPSGITFANNIFLKSSGALFSDATGTENWIGNISYGDLGISRPEGIMDIDPKLGENEAGFYFLSEGSPAIDAAKTGYPALPGYPGMGIDTSVMLDIMQQPRPDNIPEKDVGCSEYPQDIVLKPYVDGTNTGPVYLQEHHYVYIRSSVSGSGRITMDPPGGVYEAGTTVVLTAVPDSTSRFSNWEGDLSGSVTTDTLTVSSNMVVTAQFVPLSYYEVGVFINGPGKVEIDPVAETYMEGVEITLTAIPDEGYLFSHWGGQLEGSDNPKVTTVNGNMVITADFIADSSNLIRNTLAGKASGMLVYPNPVTGEIAIQFQPEYEEFVEIDLLDTGGRTIMTLCRQSIIPGQQIIKCNVSDLPPGIYLLRLKTTNNHSGSINSHQARFAKLSLISN